MSLSATFSFFSTLSLGLFIAYLSVRYRRHATEDIPLGSGLRFLRSQAGYLFMQLLFADWIQSLGFGLSWVWYGRPAGIADPSTTCTVQALAIEAGDVASAFFSLFIAVHTAAFLACQYRPPKVVLNLVCWAAWVFVALITAIGPLAIERMEQKGNFYATAGNWCWISKSYEDSRLWLHYLFVSAHEGGALYRGVQQGEKFTHSAPLRLDLRFRHRTAHRLLRSLHRERRGAARNADTERS